MTLLDTPEIPAAALNQVRDYDDTFVPAVFHPWACLLVGALAPEPGSAGLDIGTGPGTVARILATCLGPRGSVVGIDTSPAMLALAQGKPPTGGAAVSYVAAEAAHVELPSDSFDVITCQQVLQFVPDLPGTLAELRRMSRPGGRIGVVTWSGLDDNPLFAALHDAVEEVLGASSASAFREPWSLPGATISGALNEAGFIDVSSLTRALPVQFTGGSEQVCRFFTFCACSTEIMALDAAGRAELHERVDARMAPMTHHGTIHSHTTASLIVARA